MQNYNWNYPTTMWVGENRIKDLGYACKKLNINKPLLVTDNGLAKSKIIEDAVRLLKKENLTVEIFSKRLQTQERLTMQIAKTLMSALDAKGVAVTIDAAHQCMTMRGIKKEKATTVTNYFLGSFKEDLSIQNRYLKYIGK